MATTTTKPQMMIAKEACVIGSRIDVAPQIDDQWRRRQAKLRIQRLSRYLDGHVHLVEPGPGS